MSNSNECEYCEGTGQTISFKLLPSGHTEILEDCDECGGTGEKEEEE